MLNANRKYDPSKVDPRLLHSAVRALPAQHTITLDGSGVKITALGGGAGRKFIVDAPVPSTGRQGTRPEPYPSATAALDAAMAAHDDIKLGMGQ